MDTVPDLSERYPSGKLSNGISYLRLIRPHPGAWLEVTDVPKESEKSLADERTSFDTRAIDVLLILIRQLATFGYTIVSEDKPTPSEKAFIEVTNKLLGWKLDEDWHLKRHILNTIFPLDGDGGVVQWTNLDIMDSPYILGFTICSSITGSSASSTTRFSPFKKMAQAHISPESLISTTQRSGSSMIFNCDAPASLGESISRMFDPRAGDKSVIQITSLWPRFLRIEYKVTNAGPPISELHDLTFNAPEANVTPEGVERAIQTARYRLCAAVKTKQIHDDHEGIRIYWADCNEILPGEVGMYEMTESEAMVPELFRWSVEQPGVHMLFYYRVVANPDWPAFSSDTNAPGVAERHWVDRSAV